jgi:hypothetical protein
LRLGAAHRRAFHDSAQKTENDREDEDHKDQEQEGLLQTGEVEVPELLRDQCEHQP